MINCKTCPEPILPIILPIPKQPEKPDILFHNNGQGVELNYEEGRALGIYLIDKDEYEQILLEQLNYYIEWIKGQEKTAP
jgi:hypothetical protein